MLLVDSSLAGTGSGAGVDMVVIAGAGIISVDIVSIFPEPKALDQIVYFF